MKFIQRYFLIFNLLILTQSCDRTKVPDERELNEILELSTYTELQGSRFIFNHQQERVANFVTIAGIADDRRYLDTLYQQDAIFFPIIKRLDDCRASLDKELQNDIQGPEAKGLNPTSNIYAHVLLNIDTLIKELGILDEILKPLHVNSYGEKITFKKFGWELSNPTELRKRLVQNIRWNCLKELCLLEQHLLFIKTKVNKGVEGVCDGWDDFHSLISTKEVFYEVDKPIHIQGELVLPIFTKLEMKINNPFHKGESIISTGKNKSDAVLTPNKAGLHTIEGVISITSPKSKLKKMYPFHHTIYVQPASKK